MLGWQPVSLLAQWFESTPAKGASGAVPQVFNPFGWRLGTSPPKTDTNPFPSR